MKLMTSAQIRASQVLIFILSPFYFVFELRYLRKLQWLKSEKNNHYIKQKCFLNMETEPEG